MVSTLTFKGGFVDLALYASIFVMGFGGTMLPLVGPLILAITIPLIVHLANLEGNLLGKRLQIFAAFMAGSTIGLFTLTQVMFGQFLIGTWLLVVAVLYWGMTFGAIATTWYMRRRQ